MIALAVAVIALLALAAFACLVGIAHELIIKEDQTTYTPLRRTWRKIMPAYVRGASEMAAAQKEIARLKKELGKAQASYNELGERLKESLEARKKIAVALQAKTGECLKVRQDNAALKEALASMPDGTTGESVVFEGYLKPGVLDQLKGMVHDHYGRGAKS